ncbi:hypothetical protein ACFP81_13775 [Deinococcus lacus]|uniref:Polysaccharide chain length determinant N-terminal domain-containing protein n=1 Tax=Deinococcus lacus TaxID=392561 RepID=A0ABW1YF39_9DEIO
MTGPERLSSELDFSQLLQVIRRLWPVITAATLLTSGLVYSWSNSQPRRYEASGAVMSVAGSSDSNAAISSVVVSPPQLPQGAVAKLIQSRTFLGRVSELIQQSELPAAQQQDIVQQLESELQANAFESLNVRARVDAQQRGIYEIQATTGDPEGSRVLADATIKALLEWDTQRVRDGISRARQTWEKQIANIDAQIAGARAGSVDRQALVAAHGDARLSLAQVEVLEEAVTPSLSRLSDANTTRKPVSPRPVRSAALAGALALLGTTGLLVLLDLMRRKIRTSNDLAALGAPTIGEFPKLRRSQRAQAVAEVQGGDLYEPASFIRINLERLTQQGLAQRGAAYAAQAPGATPPSADHFCSDQCPAR